MRKKIKIFLGGYVNYLNAQNINCRALSELMDKNTFEVSAMLFPVGNAKDFKPAAGVRYFSVRRPVRLWRYVTYLRAIAQADVAYLPKWENDDYCRLVARLFGTKVFTTVEGMIDDLNINLVGFNARERRKFISHFRAYEPNLYAITKYIATDVARRHGYGFCDKVLYLGVDSSRFLQSERHSDSLKDIVFIGNSPSIKNVGDFFEAARRFPDLRFHAVGGNQLKDTTVTQYIERETLQNVTYHGRLDHTRLAELLKEMDLMFFPSRSEGFPKVMLETACSGVPTLCYGDYGAREWIDSWRNGIVVDTLDEALAAIAKLQANPDTLAAMSAEAVELGKSFDWHNLVKVWEAEIERIYNSK